MKTYGPFDLSSFRPGDRVEIAPWTDRWMQGDRCADVVAIGRKYLTISMDRSGQTIKATPTGIYALIN